MRFLGVLFCFALSGFAALLYETAWMREFSFVFGTSELAVVSVLAAYMGGLAAGAAAASRFAPRVRRPVLVYGLFELGIALCALAVPRAIHGTTRLYVRLFGGLPSLPDEGQLGGALFHLAASFAILLVPTALMGATLPLLARHAVRREEEIARRVGVLYTANTAGAVAGTLVAAFALLPALGLRHTVYVGAAVNALVFALAAALALRAPPVAMAPSRQDLRPEGPAWILPLLAVSGAVSVTYEVLWTRLLGHVLGGSVYAFATMLASFLAGIALGSAVAARVARTPGRASAGFAVAQLGAAALSLLAFFAVDRIADLAGALGAGARGSPPVNALFAAVALLPPAFCVGATFPCAVRLLARSEHQAAAASARAYAWNTVGAIAGAVLAGFVLLPALGYAHTLAAAAAANLLVAMLCALPSARLAPVTALAATGLAALVLLPPPTPWRLLRSSPWSPSDADGEVVYAAVGRSATVLLTEWETGWELRTNGLAEANIEGPGERPGRYRKVWWLSALPVLARPEAHTMLVVGLGGGLVVEAVPRAVRDVAVVELEPEVVNANRAIGALRRDDPLADPRVRLHVNDARGGLLLTDERFDAVVSQPSHPWVSGASHLYTREFFALVRDHLAPGGVFSQWMGLAYVDADLLRSLVATLYDVFAHVEVYVLDDHAILLASDAPLVTPDSIRAAVAAEPEHFARIGVVGPEDVLAERLFDAEAARRFAEGAPVTSDDDNLFATRSPRVLARALGREGGEALFAERSSLLTDGDAVDRLYLVRHFLRTARPRRAAAVAQHIPGAVDREVALALLDLGGAGANGGIGRLVRALGVDPGHAEARAALLRAWRARARADSPLPELLLPPADDAEAAVVEGWRLELAGDYAGLRPLDARLARIAEPEPLFTSALNLRVAWRLAAGDPERAAEAVDLVDRLQALRSVPGDSLLRAEAASRARDAPTAVASLSEIASILEGAGPGEAQRAVARRALELLAGLPPEEGGGTRRAPLRARLERAAAEPADPTATAPPRPR